MVWFKKLQNKPEAYRKKIRWGVVSVLMALVIGIWALSFPGMNLKTPEVLDNLKTDIKKEINSSGLIENKELHLPLEL